ncbi:DUF2085 domain-containing protein [Brachyspira intermedia]|uniref:DUF2085 domain-containing protein n=1 Tax=Brachyspira intermedia TaxID=84377 RepID=UPI003004BA6F
MIIRFLKKYFGKAPLCNLTASRGFFIKGFCFPLCCRCTSIILSMLIFYFLLVKININIDNFFIIYLIFSFILMIPTTVDYMHQYFTRKESTNKRRVITGIFAGFGIGIILYIVKYYKLFFIQ